MRKEIILLGALHIALSIIYIVVSLGIVAVLYSKGFFQGSASSMGEVVSAVGGGFLIVVALFGIVSGTGSIHNKGWARMIVLILGCLDLVILPLGTVLGIYTIYIFMKENIPGQLKMEVKITPKPQESISPLGSYSLPKEPAVSG